MDATEAAALHPDLHIAFRNLALATEREKLRALQDAAIQFSSAVAAGEVLKSDAVDALCSAASNHGLYSRYSGVEIEHVIGMGVEGIPSLLPNERRSVSPSTSSTFAGPALVKDVNVERRRRTHKEDGGPHSSDDCITADQLQHHRYESIQFIVPDIIPAEGITLLCSKPKLGKSWLVLDLCIGCTSDRFTLGEIKPAQGDVLYLALEDSRRRLQRRMKQLLPGFSGDWPRGLTLATEWPRVNEGGLGKITAWHGAVSKPILAVVDVLVKIRPVGRSSRSAYELDYDALSGLHKLAVDLGIAILVVHHTRKMGAEDIMDTVSGSFGLVGAADTIIVIERRSQGTVLDVRGRDVEAAELAIQFDKNTCRWTLLGPAVDVHRSDERARVLAALTEATEPLTPKEIMMATGRRDRNAFDQLLFRMLRDGDVIRPSRGKYVLSGKINKKDGADL
jgi:AAA domain